MTTKLSAQTLSFSYGSHDVLHGFDLDVTQGHIVSVVGPNGSGKSTLLKCIDGLLKPSSGKIQIDERSLLSMSRMEVARSVAYVPQSALHVFPNSVFDMVLMGRRPHLHWRCSQSDEEIVWDTLNLLGICHLALHAFNELSGGQQQKVMIARALAQKTSLILLDEPTSSLDLWHQLDVMETLRSLVKDKGLTAILAIHDLNMAARYSDEIVMMSRGKVVAVGAPKEIIVSRNLEQVYGIRAAVVSAEGHLHVVPLGRLNDTMRARGEDK